MVYELVHRYEERINELQVFADERAQLIDQGRQLKQKCADCGRESAQKHKMEVENIKQLSDKHTGVTKQLKAEINELKRKCTNFQLEQTEQNEKYNEMTRELQRAKQEKEALDETLERINEEKDVLKEDNKEKTNKISHWRDEEKDILKEYNKEKTNKISHWRDQEQMSFTLEVERIKSLCTSELVIADEKILQIQRRQCMMIDLYTQQLQALQHDYALAFSKNYQNK